MEFLVPGEKMALKGRRDARDPLETPGLWGSWARRASWASLACLATPDARVPRAPWDFLVFLEPVERREPGGCRGKQDLAGNEAPRARGASGDPEETLASPEPRAHQEVMAPTAPLERGASLDLRAPMDSLAPKAPRAPRGRMGCPGTQAREEKWASKGRRALLAPLAWWDPREQQERAVPWGREVTQGPRDLLESRACLAQLEKKEPRVTLVPLGLQGKMALPV